ncbi:hypothetical protein HYFRA_00004869 [Hymenoscyphus fraxineus]|uniref:Uncharacterized protein n=1 Tax=Hymenoscyphus fraxineus TaxID=746836 RepID=A0A9N9KKB0_9HELO|nr:hypothetical protein HYFRA_00004869 [Hymenoscyphus fraxineus]
MIRNPSSDPASKRRMRTTLSSADDHEIIRRSHKIQGMTGFPDTINKRAMGPQEQPQAVPYGTATFQRLDEIYTLYADQTSIPILQQHYTARPLGFPSNRINPGSTNTRPFPGHLRRSSLMPPDHLNISTERTQISPIRVSKHSTSRHSFVKSRKPVERRQDSTLDSVYSSFLGGRKQAANSEHSSLRSSLMLSPDLPEETFDHEFATFNIKNASAILFPEYIQEMIAILLNFWAHCLHIKGEACREAFEPPSTRPGPLPEYVNGYQSASSSSTPSNLQPQMSDDEMINPVSLEFRAPGVIAEESMSKDAFSWYVTDFNKDDWEDLPNGMTLGGRASCCGILALSRAFKEQYPNEPYGYQDPEELLDIYDQVTPNYRENVNASDEEMQALVDRLTGGSFALVVAQFQSSDFTERARRIGSDEEQEKCRKNLYLRHIPGHWEPMRRIR